MNGAIADPAAKTMMTPKLSRITIIGNSQNFFLLLRKPHKSLKNSMLSPLLVWLLYIAGDKEMIPCQHRRLLACLELAELERIFSKQPSQKTDGCYQAEEQD